MVCWGAYPSVRIKSRVHLPDPTPHVHQGLLSPRRQQVPHLLEAALAHGGHREAALLPQTQLHDPLPSKESHRGLSLFLTFSACPSGIS